MMECEKVGRKISTAKSKERTTPPNDIISNFVNCNGLRYAIPYEKKTNPIHIKDSFVGNTLDVVLGKMFRRNRGTQPIEESVAHWSKEIDEGRVEIRGPKRSKDDPWEFQIAKKEIIIQKGSSIRLHQHLHEKVVPMIDDIEFLFENDDWISINKPAGFATIDEEGGHGINSLMTMVGEKFSCKNNIANTKQKVKNKLTPAHRLDKPVSGVLLIGKSPRKAARLLRIIHQATKGLEETNGVQKVYIARVYKNKDSISIVEGEERNSEIMGKIGKQINNIVDSNEFPDQITVEAELGWDNKMKRTIVMNDSGTKEALDRANARIMSLSGNAKRSARKNARRDNREWEKKPDDDLNNDNGDDKCLSLPRKNGSKYNKKVKYSNQQQNQGHKVIAKTIHTTRFRKLKVQPDGTVLVECLPLTGYRHQIRAHLAVLGWPIANDKIYAGNYFSSEEAMYAYVDDKVHTLQQTFRSTHVSWCNKCKWIMKMLSSPESLKIKESRKNRTEESSSINISQEKDSALSPLQVDSSGIWLHSLRYVIPSVGLDISAPLPKWAQSAFKELTHHYQNVTNKEELAVNSE